MEDELAVVDGMAQPVLDVEHGLGAGLGLGIGQLPLPPASALGQAGGPLRFPQEALAVDIGAGGGDADGRLQPELAAGDVDGLLEAHAQTLGKRGHGVVARRLRTRAQHDDVRSPASHGIAGAKPIVQAVGDGLDHGVAGGVAERLVHQAQAVEIDEGEDQAPAVPLPPGQRLVHPVEEDPALACLVDVDGH